MKIECRKGESAVAILIVLFMVSFLLIFVIANGKALFNLKREIKLVDRQQKTHWENVGSKTNRVQEEAAAGPKP